MTSLAERLSHLPDPLHPADVRRLMNVSRPIFRRWVDAGMFPGAFTTPGGHVRIPQAVFVAFVEAHGPAQRPPRSRLPRRGDRFEQWLIRHGADDLVAAYRRHADMGVPLSEPTPHGEGR